MSVEGHANGNGVVDGPGTIIEDEAEFLDDVEEYMRERGVSFDRDGKVAGRPVPLHRLYGLVMDRGGYDAVTATRMLWREIAAQFNLPKQHDGAMSYQLKQLYYKNLAAYEISKYWGEIPPPPSILEQLTAKGGDVRKRTFDTMNGNDANTASPAAHNTGPSSARNSDRAVSETMQHTPKQEKMELDDQGSATRYPSRLRQQPKPAQHYQPDPTPSRTMKMRGTGSPQPTPPLVHSQPFLNASSNPRDPSFKIENYEPRPLLPLVLRPLSTPGHNPEVFYQRKQASRAATLSRPPLPQDLLRHTLPKSSFDGPNIYVRCVQGLKSGIRREQEFALHHLVKVSHERGDKFKFEGFPTLAEALLEKIVEVTELAYGVLFQVSYMDSRNEHARNTLNAVHGTDALAEQMESLTPFLESDAIESQEYITRLEKINEATLVVRNMVTLEENAVFLSRMALYKDTLVLLLHLPNQPRFEEMRQYALDMAEMTTRYFDTSPSDELYIALVDELASADRGKLLSALKAIYRFDADADRIHPLTSIPLDTVERLVQYCLLDDDELLEAVINFLYMWTASEENLSWILKEAPHLFPSITLRLSNLLVYGAMVQDENILVQRAPGPTTGSAPTIPIVPSDLFNQMLQFSEPERSAKWLRCCFEPGPNADVTQISIWQAYQNRFLHNNHIPAADFIKQVSNTISGAQAQVVSTGGQSRFIIKGIAPRRVLIGLHGQPYFKCHWEMTQTQPGPSLATRSSSCSSWHSSPEALWRHMLEVHAQIPRTQDGKFQAKDTPVPADGFRCKWLGCHKNTAIQTPAALGRHFRMHIPETAEQNRDFILKVAGEQTKVKEDTFVKHTFYFTSTDDRGWPCGVPFMSALLLYNLARYVARFGGSEKRRKELMGLLFSVQVRENLWSIFSKHRTIAGLIIDVLRNIEKGEAPEKRTAKHHDEGQTQSLF